MSAGETAGVRRHSPGPWIWFPDGVIETESGSAVCFVNDHKNVRTVHALGEQFSHADARLIAAAPEMLELLRQLRDQPGAGVFSERIDALLDRIDGAPPATPTPGGKL